MLLRGWPRSLWKLLLLNALIALGLVVMLTPFHGRAFWPVFHRYFGINLVIANSIGLLCGLILPMVGPAVAERPLWQGGAAFLIAMLGVSATGCWVATVIVRWLWNVRLDLWEIYRTGAIITVLVGAGAIIAESYRHRMEAANLELKHRQVEQERALQLAAAARLSSIESRVQPHFLFNALNSISSLIREDPERAEHLVGRLSSLLRGSLDTHAESLIPLRREIELVRDYLEIQQARFEKRLRWEVRSDADASEVPVPPFAIQTLVENSVKHAVSVKRDGGSIEVRALLDGGRLKVEVEDDGPGFELANMEPGHGLDNLSARLTGLFGDEGALQVRRGPGGTGSVAGFTVPGAANARVSG